jgi:ligand-binding SRPBCC domain-containing protein
MPRAYYRVLLDAPLEAVWAFHEDTEAGLRALSPPEADVQITRADPPGVGARVVIRAKTPIGRKRWVAEYLEWQPPHGSRPHRIAWFVDKAVESPFKSWVHTHRFEETVDQGRTKVWAIDDVRYEVPLGPLGLVGDRLIVRPQLNKMFAHRHAKLRELLCRREAVTRAT